jgi:hypothetical protein
VGKFPVRLIVLAAPDNAAIPIAATLDLITKTFAMSS